MQLHSTPERSQSGRRRSSLLSNTMLRPIFRDATIFAVIYSLDCCILEHYLYGLCHPCAAKFILVSVERGALVARRYCERALSLLSLVSHTDAARQHSSPCLAFTLPSCRVRSSVTLCGIQVVLAGHCPRQLHAHLHPPRRHLPQHLHHPNLPKQNSLSHQRKCALSSSSSTPQQTSFHVKTSTSPSTAPSFTPGQVTCRASWKASGH